MWWTGFETASGRIASIDCFDIPAWKLFVCRDAGSILREEAAFNIQNIIANRKTWFKICLRWRRRFNAGNQIRLNQCISGYFALLNISKHSHQIWIGVDSTWFMAPRRAQEMLIFVHLFIRPFSPRLCEGLNLHLHLFGSHSLQEH